MAKAGIMGNVKTYLDKSYIKLVWLEDQGILLNSWKGFASYDEIVEVGNRISMAAQMERVEKILYDARGLEILDEPSEQYISGQFTKRMLLVGVKKAAVVWPEDVFAKFSIDNIKNKLDATHHLEMRFFKSLEKAMKWLKAD